MQEDTKDYSQSGFDIQYATLDQAKRFGAKKMPRFLNWGKYKITTADSITAPKTGIVRGEFLSVKDNTEQGFDLDVKGYIKIRDGRKIFVLRTWYDVRLPSVVEYPYQSDDGLIWVWNVYKMKYGGGQIVEEKWTGNAGFWIEELGPMERIYHCSQGAAHPPDFESLVFKITVRP